MAMTARRVRLYAAANATAVRKFLKKAAKQRPAMRKVLVRESEVMHGMQGAAGQSRFAGGGEDVAMAELPGSDFDGRGDAATEAAEVEVEVEVEGLEAESTDSNQNGEVGGRPQRDHWDEAGGQDVTMAEQQQQAEEVEEFFEVDEDLVAPAEDVVDGEACVVMGGAQDAMAGPGSGSSTSDADSTHTCMDDSDEGCGNGLEVSPVPELPPMRCSFLHSPLLVDLWALEERAMRGPAASSSSPRVSGSARRQDSLSERDLGVLSMPALAELERSFGNVAGGISRLLPITEVRPDGDEDTMLEDTPLGCAVCLEVRHGVRSEDGSDRI